MEKLSHFFGGRWGTIVSFALGVISLVLGAVSFLVPAGWSFRERMMLIIYIALGIALGLSYFLMALNSILTIREKNKVFKKKDYLESQVKKLESDISSIKKQQAEKMMPINEFQKAKQDSDDAKREADKLRAENKKVQSAHDVVYGKLLEITGIGGLRKACDDALSQFTSLRHIIREDFVYRATETIRKFVGVFQGNPDDTTPWSQAEKLNALKKLTNKTRGLVG